MADKDVADMKGTERQDLREQGEKPLAEAKGDTETTENVGGEDLAATKAGTEEE